MGAAGGAGGEEPSVRVLLRETAGPIRVGVPGGHLTTLEAVPGGLRADGRPVAGASWSLDGALLRVDQQRVRGGIEVLPGPAGLLVVNRVPLEHYVLGTLGREVYPGWEAETLKAQAVVTRTYALYRARRSQDPWHLEATTRGQVYGGADAEWEAGRKAVAATRGEYLAWGGEPILAAFHSASGGRTASSEEVWGQAFPYLVSVDVADEQDSPDTYWRTPVSGTTLVRALAPFGIQVGRLVALRVAERSPSGRVRSLRVQGREGEAHIQARALREALGAEVIRSTLFEIREAPEGWVFVGSGHGHGVGMSQWGAQAMARGGASYREILSAFYPGARILQGARP